MSCYLSDALQTRVIVFQPIVIASSNDRRSHCTNKALLEFVLGHGARYPFNVASWPDITQLQTFHFKLQKNIDKRCVINDPLGQTHSPTSSDHFIFKRRLFCDILKSGDRHTD